MAKVEGVLDRLFQDEELCQICNKVNHQDRHHSSKIDAQCYQLSM